MHFLFNGRRSVSDMSTQWGCGTTVERLSQHGFYNVILSWPVSTCQRCFEQIFPCQYALSVWKCTCEWLKADWCWWVIGRPAVYEFQLVDSFIRPPDILVGGLGFYRDFSIYTCLLLLFFRQLHSEFAERNLTQTDNVRKWVRFENACPKPTNRESKITFSDDFAT